MSWKIGSINDVLMLRGHLFLQFYGNTSSKVARGVGLFAQNHNLWVHKLIKLSLYICGGLMDPSNIPPVFIQSIKNMYWPQIINIKAFLFFIFLSIFWKVQIDPNWEPHFLFLCQYLVKVCRLLCQGMTSWPSNP